MAVSNMRATLLYPIEVLRKEGYSVRRIASLIGVHHSTVARELNRVEGEYSAIKAQQLAISKSANKGSPIKLTYCNSSY